MDTNPQRRGNPSCRICIFLYHLVHWGFGVGDFGLWGLGVSGQWVDRLTGGLGRRENKEKSNIDKRNT